MVYLSYKKSLNICKNLQHYGQDVNYYETVKKVHKKVIKFFYHLTTCTLPVYSNQMNRASLTVPNGTVGILFPSQGGHINPRVLHKAQQKIAKSRGCQIIDDVVNSIHQESPGHQVLHTDSGKQISAKKMLLATGAFTECRKLLPKGVSPAMDSTTETVLFVSTRK